MRKTRHKQEIRKSSNLNSARLNSNRALKTISINRLEVTNGLFN